MTQWGLDTLFNPAKRHMDEEKRRLQSTREQLSDSSGGKRIDLESGRVTIRRAEDDDAVEATEATDAADPTGATAATEATNAHPEPAPADESDAARRARLRRAKGAGKG